MREESGEAGRKEGTPGRVQLGGHELHSNWWETQQKQRHIQLAGSEHIYHIHFSNTAENRTGEKYMPVRFDKD